MLFKKLWNIPSMQMSTDNMYTITRFNRCEYFAIFTSGLSFFLIEIKHYGCTSSPTQSFFLLPSPKVTIIQSIYNCFPAYFVLFNHMCVYYCFQSFKPFHEWLTLHAFPQSTLCWGIYPCGYMSTHLKALLCSIAWISHSSFIPLLRDT